MFSPNTVRTCPADGPPNGPPFRAGRSAFDCSLPLHLAMINPHMYYMSSLFYHSFVILNHAFSCHLHTIAIIHGIFIYQASLHLCRDRDTGARGAWARDRWRRHSHWDSRQAPKHFLHPTLDQWSICVLLRMSYYIYHWIFRTYLMHYQPWLGCHLRWVCLNRCHELYA